MFCVKLRFQRASLVLENTYDEQITKRLEHLELSVDQMSNKFDDYVQKKQYHDLEKQIARQPKLWEKEIKNLDQNFQEDLGIFLPNLLFCLFN